MDVRVGIHTGKVVAGIIGSKIVRYDILGEGVLITNKIQVNGIPGKVCVSEDTRKIIMSNPEIANEFYLTEHEMVNIPGIGRRIQSYQLTQKDTDSFEQSEYNSQYNSSLEGEQKPSNSKEMKSNSQGEMRPEHSHESYALAAKLKQDQSNGSESEYRKLMAKQKGKISYSQGSEEDSA